MDMEMTSLNLTLGAKPNNEKRWYDQSLLLAGLEEREIEAKRLEALRDYQVLDTAPEPCFDDLTRLAADICQVPIAAISLTDTNRQWFKSKVGIVATEEPRNITFCSYTIQQTELLIIPDTLADKRFATNPCVFSYKIRFYAGAPLLDPNGLALGTLCVLDYVSRELSNEQQQALGILARQVVTQLELRRNLKVLKQSIAESQRWEKLLLHNALHDALTGLPNRVLFMERLGQALERTKRCEDNLFAVLFLDLDRFKIVNDSLGHMIGDQLLQAFARQLQTCVRDKDTVARLGGDEFAILLEDIQDVANAIHIADHIQKTLTLPFILNGYDVFTSASIGIALGSIGYDKPEDMLRDADTAMYRAKALGTTTHYQVFDKIMHAQAMALLQLETDLRWAIERNEFRIHYQPIVSLSSGKIIGFEALLRWQHALRGLVSPMEFIPMAEETGLIIPIGWWVLREACRQMRAWQLQFPVSLPLTMSVNISSQQFSQPDLIKQIQQILDETGLEPRNLKLEVTESVLMANAESTAATMLQLQALGIQFSIDDFGTGYSSLSYLHRFPISMLKIDRSFVKNMDFDVENNQIISAIMALAWSLGMNVVAEGIEKKKQLSQLQELKCEFGQGYFFSKPLDSEMASALIAAEALQL